MNLPVRHASTGARASKSDIDIPFARPMLGEEEQEAVARVLSGHVLTHGPYIEKFEQRFAELIGVSEAVAVSSCTAALHLSLLGLGIEAGDDSRGHGTRRRTLWSSTGFRRCITEHREYRSGVS
jgi:hypothetical protein